MPSQWPRAWVSHPLYWQLVLGLFSTSTFLSFGMKTFVGHFTKKQSCFIHIQISSGLYPSHIAGRFFLKSSTLVVSTSPLSIVIVLSTMLFLLSNESSHPLDALKVSLFISFANLKAYCWINGPLTGMQCLVESRTQLRHYSSISSFVEVLHRCFQMPLPSYCSNTSAFLFKMFCPRLSYKHFCSYCWALLLLLFLPS